MPPGSTKWIAGLLLLVRRGLPAMAVYAMLLQAFLAVAAPAAASFDPAGQPICSGLASGDGTNPDHGRTGTHGCVCIAGCAHMGHAGPPADQQILFVRRDPHRSADSAPARRFLVVEAPVFPGLGPRAPPRA